MIEGYDDVQEAQPGPAHIPTDYYYVEVADIMGKGVTGTGVPYVRTRLRIMEGPMANRSVFITHWLGNAGNARVNDGETQEQANERARRITMAVNKKLLNSLGVMNGTAHGEGADKIFNLYNVDQWKDKQMIARIRQAGEDDYGMKYRLGQVYHLDDEKRGLQWWRQQNAQEAPNTGGSL